MYAENSTHSDIFTIVSVLLHKVNRLVCHKYFPMYPASISAACLWHRYPGCSLEPTLSFVVSGSCRYDTLLSPVSRAYADTASQI